MNFHIWGQEDFTQKKNIFFRKEYVCLLSKDVLNWYQKWHIL